MTRIAASVFIPEWGSVDIACTLDNAFRLCPCSGRITIDGLHHIHAEVGITPIDIILSGVITDARCPDTIAVLGSLKVLQQFVVTLIEVADGIVDDFPVDEVL